MSAPIRAEVSAAFSEPTKAGFRAKKMRRWGKGLVLQERIELAVIFRNMNNINAL